MLAASNIVAACVAGVFAIAGHVGGFAGVLNSDDVPPGIGLPAVAVPATPTGRPKLPLVRVSATLRLTTARIHHAGRRFAPSDVMIPTINSSTLSASIPDA